MRNNSEEKDAPDILDAFVESESQKVSDDSDFASQYEKELASLIGVYKESQKSALAWKNRIRICLVTITILLIFSPVVFVSVCMFLVGSGLVEANSYAVLGGFLTSIIGFITNIKILLDVAAKYAFDKKESEKTLRLFKHAEQHLHGKDTEE